MRELHGAVATSVNVSVAKPPLSGPRPQPLDQLLDLAKSLVDLRQRAREPILGRSLGDGDFEVRDRNPDQLQQAARLFARHGASSPSAYAACTPGALLRSWPDGRRRRALSPRIRVGGAVSEVRRGCSM